MSRVTNQDANRFVNKVDNMGTALKGPSFGGPFKADYGADTQYMGAAGNQYQIDHPRYPDYVYPDDKERDTHMQVKKQLASNSTIAGLVYAGNEDIQYFKDKKAAQELAMFKQFVEDSIPRGTPWAKDYFERIMPGWYQSKIEIINEKMSIVQRYIDITVRGPQNIEDMYLLYQIYTGKYALPATFSELINGATAVARQDFASGLFNPNRYVTAQVRIAQRNQANLANFAIPGIDTKEIAAAGQLAVNPDANVDLAAEMAFTGGMSHARTAAADVPAQAGFWGTTMIGPNTRHLAAPGREGRTATAF
jgi:hypothetical protein